MRDVEIMLVVTREKKKKNTLGFGQVADRSFAFGCVDVGSADFPCAILHWGRLGSGFGSGSKSGLPTLEVEVGLGWIMALAFDPRVLPKDDLGSGSGAGAGLELDSCSGLRSSLRSGLRLSSSLRSSSCWSLESSSNTCLASDWCSSSVLDLAGGFGLGVGFLLVFAFVLALAFEFKLALIFELELEFSHSVEPQLVRLTSCGRVSMSNH